MLIFISPSSFLSAMADFPRSTCGEFYVSMVFDDIKKVSLEQSKHIDSLAEKYFCLGRGDPKFGLPKNLSAQEGHYAFTFEGSANAAGFTKEVLGLEYVLETRIGLVKK